MKDMHERSKILLVKGVVVLVDIFGSSGLLAIGVETSLFMESCMHGKWRCDYPSFITHALGTWRTIGGRI